MRGRLIRLLAATILVASCGSPSAQQATGSPRPDSSKLGTAFANPQASAVARTAQPTASPLPTPTPGPQALVWRKMGSVVRLFEPWALVGYAGGYVALDEVGLPRFSRDGSVWHTISLPLVATPTGPKGETAGASAFAAAASDREVILVGAYAHGPCASDEPFTGGPACPYSPISWVSRDGLTWRSSYRCSSVSAQTIGRKGCPSVPWPAATASTVGPCARRWRPRSRRHAPCRSGRRR